MRRFPLSLLLLTAFLLAISALEGCRTFKSNPGTTLTITNLGTGLIKEVEVNYPGGTVGTSSIGAGQSFTKWIPAKGCNLSLKFLDASNKQQPTKQVDLGATCPKAFTIEVASDYSVSARATQ